MRTQSSIKSQVAIIGLAASALIGLGGPACGGRGDDPPAPEFRGWSPASIKVYVGVEGKRVDFAPSFDPAPQEAPSGALGKKVLVTTEDDAGPATKSAKDIVVEASRECGYFNVTDNFWLWDGSAATSSWYFFEHAPTSCEEVLKYEEVMLCVAQKLEDIATTVAPITWRKDDPLGKWVIPPQATADRFIVRDWALVTLANLALTDMVRFPLTNGSETQCSTALGIASNGKVYYTGDTPVGPNTHYNDLGRIFTAAAAPEYLLPALNIRQTVDGTFTGMRTLVNTPELAKAFLSFEAHVLRAASRLAEDIIRGSVTDDLAGAEKARTAGIDPLSGNRLAWGTESTLGDATYNSLTHASRVLFGRLDVPGAVPWYPLNTWPGPSCTNAVGGTTAARLSHPLKDSYGVDLTARTGHVPPVNKNQRLALEMLQGAGILVPRSTLASTAFSTVRLAVSKQLKANAAENVGVLPDDTTWPEDPRAKAMDRAFAAIGDGDLRYALERTFDLYRLMTHTADGVSSISLDTIGTSGGLKPATFVATELTALGGTAVKGGLSHRNLVYDFMARAGSLQTASQCGQTAPDSASQWSYAKAFQTPFSMAQELYLRMFKLRDAAAALVDVAAIADEAKAEMRAFSGPGFLDAYMYDTSGTITVWLYSYGVERAGLNTAVAEEKASSLVLVKGPSWMADCVAGLRANCPDNVAANTFASSNVDAHTSPRVVDGPAYRRTFTVTGMTFSGASAPATNLYVVIPKYKGKAGKVLGVIAPKVSNYDVVLTVSDVQRELMNKVLGFDERSGSCGSRFNEEADPSKSPAYCIKDAPRNLYVPLTNEVTSDSTGVENSWRYYLRLAREAAERADGLAAKLIDVGTQQDLRREAANEEFAKVCGSFSALETMKFTDGKIDSSSIDDSIKSCIDDKKISVVALSQKPTADAVETELLGCNATGPKHPKCGVLTDDDVDGLGIVTRETDSTAGCVPSGFMTEDCNVQCASILSAVDSLPKGFDAAAVSSALTASWAKRDTLQGTVGTLSLKVEANLDWSLSALGAPLMNSAQTSPLYPGCLRGSSGSGVSGNCGGNHAAHVFNHLLRGEKRADSENMSAVSPEDAKLLLWRLEGMLWTLGVVSGGVPEGMFQVPVPAADLGGIQFNAGELVPIVTVYGRGLWTTEAGTTKLSATSNGEIRAKVGAASTLDSGYTWPTGAAEIPLWLREFYKTDANPLRAGYLHVRARSAAAAPTDLNDPEHPVVSVTGDLLASYLSDTATKLAGIRCSDGSSIKFTGMPSSGTTGSADAANVIGRWKTSSWPGSSSLLRWTATDLGLKDVGLIRAQLGANDLLTTIQGIPSVSLAGSCCFTNPIYYNQVTNKNVADLHDHSLAQTSQWSPADVARVFVNSYPPSGTCGAAAQLAQTLALACVATDETVFPKLDSPPVITDLSQLGAMQRWLNRQSKKVKDIVGRLYLEDVPKSVVDEFKTGKAGASGSGGDRAVLNAKLAGSLTQIARIADSLSGDLHLLSLAFADVQTQVALAKIDTNITVKELTIRRLSIYGAMAGHLAKAAEVSIVSAFTSNKDAVEAVDAAVQIALLEQQRATLTEIEQDYMKKEGLVIENAFNTLQTTVTRLFTSVKENVGSIRTQAAETRALLEEIRAASTRATYQAAKAAGQPFVLDSSGKPIASYPVNAVLNRQYAITEQRYKRSLNDAKYMAYLARLAIEQRFGVRLENIATRVGSLDPPSQWVNTVCTLSGIDYKSLSSTSPTDGGTEGEKKLIGEFADQYIGDYIDKLERFVEFYNIEHPSHEGDDMVVLSLKNDLLGGSMSCVKTASNLLYYSNDLASSDVIATPAGTAVRGWQRPFCGGATTRCVEILPASSLLGGGTLTSPATGEASNSVSWVRETTRIATTPDAGSDAVAEIGPPATGAPPGSVSQQVHLEPGSYILSWWDQARSATGDLVTSSADAIEYRLGIYDSSGKPLSAFTGEPYYGSPSGDAGTADAADPSVGDSQWSARRRLVVTVGVAGEYYLALTPSTGDSLGSLAVTGLQLEWTDKPTSEPSVYVGTTSSRDYVSAACGERSTAQMQSAFKRDCDATGACYYELVAPFDIDTIALDTATSRIRGKLAAGNYNYRHIDTFVNLVGTGVRDCSKSPTADCFGSGFIEYSLFHDAFQTSVLGWDGDYECFNFGSAAIRRGKALAAERYITLPVGSADMGLLTQPAIEKHEFRGRPLDGSYKLRVWESPALAWNRLDDVQLIFKYRYWSRVDSTK